MPKGYVIGHVKLRVEVLLNEPQLAALLYDALKEEGEVGPRTFASLSLTRIRDLVRSRVARHGEDSASCGPQDPEGCDEMTEKRCVSAVRRAFLGASQ